MATQTSPARSSARPFTETGTPAGITIAHSIQKADAVDYRIVSYVEDIR
jgi:hypothetical protein